LIFVDSLSSNPANGGLVGYINELDTYDKPYLPQIMESNYMYDLSLAEFARLGHRSLATFKRDFFKHYLTPPGKWLLQKRAERAHLLLTTTKSNVNDIALESGFESGAHFSRVFKEQFGYSPNHSRQKVGTGG
jgi:AraC family transcriptional regulator, exoenzyme S synthesis regulatory protein ExsA